MKMPSMLHTIARILVGICGLGHGLIGVGIGWNIGQVFHL
jgi:uncharacterized membrane protein YuzA (DUF378 family)